ncbi:ABC transporter ATP-binding protein [Aquiflexum gelatinilyticum]|uniref:ABC transporter ATP-binding protein/permease n=1 Tax=Aquiflexum gelatinilyticum TaxID=2961943 RepID=A0A9X2P2L9_9BACT|nr:ABC transporter ATP-binding protein [Aquiflexum gelatinilyticum]MCR9014844.1 ABC transporter ATP-binding protein/permease [Aquiflexum gelatinilyticum]
MIKSIIKNYLQHFTYFYSYLGNRIFISFGLSIGVALLDGLGLAMFLPLLEMMGGGEQSIESLGNLRFLIDGFNSLNISLTMTSVLVVMLLFFVLKGIVRFIESYYKVILQRYFIQKIRFSQIDLLTEYNYKSFVMSDSGRIQNTVSGEVNKVLGAYNGYFFAMQGLIMVMVYTGLAFTVNPQFTILVIIGGSMSNLLYSWIFKKTKAISRKLTDSNHDFQGLLIQKVAFFKYLKATGQLKDFSNKLKEKVTEIENYLKRIGFLNAFINGIREPLVITVVVGVIILEINALDGSINLILLSLLFFYRALTYLMNLQNYWNAFLANHGSLENMQEFLTELEFGKEENGKIEFEGFEKEIKFQGVGFQYRDEVILTDLNFSIKKNQTVALVGESGSGKTTLMNLLSGLVLPDRGTITVDGKSILDLERGTYQKKIGYITQDPVIFDDTVFNNVTFWAEPNEANKRKFWKALEQASIGDFVKGLPELENTRLGNNGIMVSGGQKQRFSIARELFKDVDFLMMDEATSALDSETEQLIKQNMELLKGKVTIIMIAHRLSTVKHADQIILLNKGQIKEIDNFEGLASNSESFRRMVEAQEF